MATLVLRCLSHSRTAMLLTCSFLPSSFFAACLASTLVATVANSVSPAALLPDNLRVQGGRCSREEGQQVLAWVKGVHERNARRCMPWGWKG